MISARCIGGARRCAPASERASGGERRPSVGALDRVDERIVFDILAGHRRDLAELLDLLLAIDE